MSDDVLTRDNDGNLAVRTVSSTGDNYVNPDDVYTRDSEGKLCVRTTGQGGGGGGDQHNLGWYATQSALEEAHPTATAGDWAIVGSTDTVWIWDTDDSAWVDSDQKGQVTSVNGETGAVVLDAQKVGALPADTPIPDPQVNSDWNATSGVAEILNKPTIPSDAKDVNAVPQYTTMPTPSASNLGEVAQYSGETVPEDATITQTVGSGLTDLAVALEDFVEAEQPMGDETVEFTVTVVAPHVESRVVNGYTTLQSGTIADFDNMFQTLLGETHDHFYMWYNGVTWGIQPEEAPGSGVWFNITTEQLTEAGIILSGQFDPDDEIEITLFRNATGIWEKNGETVDLAAYGITYTGTPSDGDELTVDYVKGITQGYFYLNTPTYSEPTATISQTTGSGLTDLAVDVDTFVATEQPTQSESVVFECQETQEAIDFTTVESTGTIEGTASEFVDFMRTEYGFWDTEKYSGTITIYPDNSVEVGPQSGGVWFTSSVATLETYGLMVNNLSAVNASKINYDYTPADGIWFKNGNIVDLSAYGITYTGTPNDNDELTVVYTAPIINGYNWNQINVQPAAEGGGSAGIEWKTIVDLPVGATSNWRISALYRVAGGLPYGNYEVYWQVKDLAPYGVSYRPYAVATWLLRFNVSANEVRGYISPVIDGSFGGSNEKKLPTANNTIWSGLFYKDGNDFIIVARDSNYLETLIPGYSPTTDVPECFKLSAIVNVDTGQKYIATGILDDGGSYTGYSTTMYIMPIQNTPDQRDYLFSANNIELSNSSADGIYLSDITISTGSGIERTERLDIILESPLGKYNASFKGLISDYEFIVYEATGVFENAQLGYDNYGSFGLKFNLPNNTNTTFSWRVAYYGSRENPSAYITTGLATFKGTFVPLKPGSTIREGVIGKILQYTGVTDANYTNGYFYKANGTPVIVPQSLVGSDFTPSDCSVSIDVDNLIPALSNNIGWSVDDVKYNFNTYKNWIITYDWDNNTIESVYWNAFGNMYYADVLSCFTVSTTGSYSGSQTIEFNATYTPQQKEVQNPSWDRVDVQPSNYATPPSADGTYVLKATVSSGTVTYSWVAE